MKPGDLVVARGGDARLMRGLAVLVIDIARSFDGVRAVCILVDGRAIWVNGEMLEVLNEVE